MSGRSHPELSFVEVNKYFVRGNDAVQATRDCTFDVAPGEFVSLIGPSGCGKSTLLNIAAGFMKPTSGTVKFRGGDVPSPNTFAGYMTQGDSLLGWRTVRDNVALPLKLRGVSVAERAERVSAILATVGLDGFEDAYPSELSGGMRKRAMLARTWVYEPEMLLADEPFGALDAQLRLILTHELLALWRRHRHTILFVTHDVAEAITVSDRVIVMSSRPGEIVEDYTVPIERPRDVFRIRSMSGFVESYDLLWGHISKSIER